VVDSKYVVSVRHSGLGDKLICLCAAWLFARNTSRSLVVDWRFSRYLRKPINMFSHCFVHEDLLAGVPLIAGDTTASLRLPQPRYPDFWDDDNLMSAPWLTTTDGFSGEREAAVELIRSGRDIEAPTVVFRTCVNDGVVSWLDARTCLEALRPVARIADAVKTFQQEHLRSTPWIGLHVRHGNGGNIMAHTPSWQSFDHAIERCAKAVKMARDEIGHKARVFLSTDSVEVQDSVQNCIPDVICRPKYLAKPGAGELHLGDCAEAGLDDALVEMFLLAQSDVLIRYPSGSFFSFYAAMLKPSRLPPPSTVYDLQTACNPLDPLSPAVIF
jgi:hypothetical protein